MGALKLEHLPSYTYDDYANWEGKWELIHGIAYNMSPAPVKKHQFISSNIAWELKNALLDCPRCIALLPVDWRISDDTVVCPDNLVVCDEDMEGAYIVKAPLIIFEVLSKSTASKDCNL
ncbi:MAG TPA: Uma2 family endonuclease, partial [Campylobacterales bacterium]|nr:Uma2 family endonuclease [Campylobacterales bacterium]